MSISMMVELKTNAHQLSNRRKKIRDGQQVSKCFSICAYFLCSLSVISVSMLLSSHCRNHH